MLEHGNLVSVKPRLSHRCPQAARNLHAPVVDYGVPTQTDRSIWPLYRAPKPLGIRAAR